MLLFVADTIKCQKLSCENLNISNGTLLFHQKTASGKFCVATSIFLSCYFPRQSRRTLKKPTTMACQFCKFQAKNLHLYIKLQIVVTISWKFTKLSRTTFLWSIYEGLLSRAELISCYNILIITIILKIFSPEDQFTQEVLI